MSSMLRSQPLILFAVLGSRAASEVERTLSPLGIDSRELAILDYLASAPGLVPQATLSFRLRRDRTTIMQLCRSLAAKGLAVQDGDTRDGRLRGLAITELGRERWREAEDHLLGAAENYFWPLSGEEFDALLETLRRVLVPFPTTEG